MMSRDGRRLQREGGPLEYRVCTKIGGAEPAGRDRIAKSLDIERTVRGMIKVKSRGNESLEQMLRRFKKMCEKEGLTKEIKRTSYYEKPSERRRRRARKSAKRDVRAGR